MQDRSEFYARVTEALFHGSLPDWQKAPLDRLIDEGAARGRSRADIAYVLATAYHETGRFKHAEEIGRGEGRAYGVDVPVMGTGSKVTKWARYHGRGYVQITWAENYGRAAAATGVDLISAPDRAMEPGLAAKIAWEGMIGGWFTGHNLADYREGEAGLNFVEARRIVNGVDRADLIAGYAAAFDEALALIVDIPDASPLGECPVPGCPMQGVV